MHCPDGHGEMKPHDIQFEHSRDDGAEFRITASGLRCLECRMEVLTATEAEWAFAKSLLSTAMPVIAGTLHLKVEIVDNTPYPDQGKAT